MLVLDSSLDIEEAVIQEYDQDYCFELEAAYGKGMMSEGGHEAIDRLLEGVSLVGKKGLDIGAGLGGVAYHVASKGARVTGLEINPWMVKYANLKTPQTLRNKLSFVLKEKGRPLPFESEFFDFVYSKGVLTHVLDKPEMFSEIHRVSKTGASFVINDWLSSEDGKWGPLLTKLTELEGLSLFAHSETSYVKMLEEAGFTQIQVRDEQAFYSRYNREIIERLSEPSVKASFIHRFGESKWQSAITGYECIASAIEKAELRVMHILCQKK